MEQRTSDEEKPGRRLVPTSWPRWMKVTSVTAVTAVVLASSFACSGSSSGSNGTGKPLPGPTQTPEPSSNAGTLPADRVAPSKAPCATTPRPAGWVKAENEKPGDSGWKASFDPDTFVNGYLSQVSAACGDTVDLHLSGYVGSASVTAYRMGWYGGKGGRVVWSTSHVPVSAKPVSKSGAPTYTVEASWPVAAEIKITSDWQPGFYLLVARPKSSSKGDAIPLVIRDDSAGNGASGTGSSPLLFQASVLTYQAYNTFGGYSLYNGKDTSSKRSDRSRVASFDRPYAGSGYEAPYLYDIPLLTEIEKQGLDVDYTTDIDVDQRPSQVSAHKALIIGGHSEYWTRRMYDTAVYARDHGVNIAFFGANTVYWHTRLEPSPRGADRRMVVYRFDPDPLAAKDPSQATTEWRLPPLNRPEAALVGADYDSYDAIGGGFSVLQPDSWIFAGTGVKDKQVLKYSVGFKTTAGGEWDKVLPDRPYTPQNIDVIAAAPIILLKIPTMATLSYYSAPSGAGVFSGGTTFWPCLAAGMCNGDAADPQTSHILSAMTDNVLRAFAAGPAGTAHPSQRHLPPSPQALIAQAPTQEDVAVRSK
jgi:hypothetical protein